MWRNVGAMTGAYIIWLTTDELYSCIPLFGWLVSKGIISNGYEFYLINVLIGRPIPVFVACMFIGLFARNRHIILALLIAGVSCGMAFWTRFYFLPSSVSKNVTLSGGLSPLLSFVVESTALFVVAVAGSMLGNRIAIRRRNRRSNLEGAASGR